MTSPFRYSAFYPSARTGAAPCAPAAWAGLRIGLLGGSFNPPHAGHRELSLTALARLRLDLVIWLVTPGNPLKAAGGYAPLAERLHTARQVARHPRILISDLEARPGQAGPAYTAQTLALLRRRYPATRFVWLMGADNLAGFHRWHRWRAIAKAAPIAVFNRPGSGLAALNAPAARSLAAARLPQHAVPLLAGSAPPAWIFLPEMRNSLSSTALRARKSAIA